MIDCFGDLSSLRVQRRPGESDYEPSVSSSILCERPIKNELQKIVAEHGGLRLTLSIFLPSGRPASSDLRHVKRAEQPRRRTVLNGVVATLCKATKEPGGNTGIQLASTNTRDEIGATFLLIMLH